MHNKSLAQVHANDLTEILAVTQVVQRRLSAFSECPGGRSQQRVGCAQVLNRIIQKKRLHFDGFKNKHN
ncbi:hypothetical protein SCLCIDRAFT_1213496 [Scleroderma citrinum Foug A]|uniref:Uncharacterized protein n=1 Tax=Scleroderma citrinum Foug A TaxID=1036808 RepID=A0A0C3E801_9AGAM|nr:hypothetical protein SCLCIDRAFT_1213496 [Scleroderma citrinum Foug A]